MPSAPWAFTKCPFHGATKVSVAVIHSICTSGVDTDPDTFTCRVDTGGNIFTRTDTSHYSFTDSTGTNHILTNRMDADRVSFQKWTYSDCDPIASRPDADVMLI